ncbi:MAG TPA: PilZ domain-containing protein [Alphaproteobacteria bacterium]|nr:PilZ domain-containing protein [Alphaproteobacteria bacterium]
MQSTKATRKSPSPRFEGQEHIFGSTGTGNIGPDAGSRAGEAAAPSARDVDDPAASAVAAGHPIVGEGPGAVPHKDKVGAIVARYLERGHLDAVVRRGLHDLVELAGKKPRDSRDRRLRRRVPTILSGMISIGKINITVCTVRNISRTGVLLLLPRLMSMPDRFELTISGVRTMCCRTVRQSGRKVGAEFTSNISPIGTQR